LAFGRPAEREERIPQRLASAWIFVDQLAGHGLNVGCELVRASLRSKPAARNPRIKTAPIIVLKGSADLELPLKAGSAAAI